MGHHILQEKDGDLFHLIHGSKHELTGSVDINGYLVVPPNPFGRKDWEKPDTGERPYALEQRVALKGYVSERGVLEERVLDLASSDTIEKDLERISEGIDKPFVFVSHAPPFNTPLDVIFSGLHVGSLGVRRFIERWSEEGLLLASFHGHIHESPKRSGKIFTRINQAFCVNPGQGNGRGSVFRYVCFSLREDEISISFFEQ